MPNEVVQFLRIPPGEGGCGVPLDDGSVRALHDSAIEDNQDQFASRRQVNWVSVRERCEELLSRSKHLDVAMPYAVALLELEGLPGFVQGLELIARLVGESWRNVYPRLDHGDDDDPTERIGILDTLGAPLATYGDRWQVLMRLRRAALISPPSHGTVLAGSVLALAPGAALIPDIPVLSKPVLEAALRVASTDALKSMLAVLESGRTHVAAIEQAFRDHAANGRGPNLTGLDQDLSFLTTTIQNALQPTSASRLTERDLQRTEPAGTRSGWAGGEIRSSEQVRLALEEICRYYETHEPANPVPLLLLRAHRLVKADFLTIVGELIPNALSDVKAATGFREPASSRTT